MTNTDSFNAHIGLSFTYHYYDDTLVPSAPLYKEKEYLAPSPLLHYDGVELLYVTAGQGTVTVNGIAYAAACGSFFVLFPHHITRIAPGESKDFRVIHCKITHATYLFLLANPCCHSLTFGYTDAPAVLTFETEEQKKIGELFQLMRAELKNISPMQKYMMNSLLTEILGRADRRYNAAQTETRS